VSSANLELVRTLYAAWERGDFSATEWADPEIEYVIADGPAPGRWTGLAGMAEAYRAVLEVWEGFRGEAQEYRELDDERVLVLVRVSARGKTSGLEVGQTGARTANLIHIREGKVTKMVYYWDRNRALADLGLGSDQSP
jgi:ketosteroid isomerase-like protein